jgi:aryl-alcohol dehydrogenase-like predicted oxidoreductase
VAWVLQNQNVAAAIIGASRPEQVLENVKASGIKLETEVMQAIDAVIGIHAESDPRLTISPNPRA